MALGKALAQRLLPHALVESLVLCRRGRAPKASSFLLATSTVCKNCSIVLIAWKPAKCVIVVCLSTRSSDHLCAMLGFKSLRGARIVNCGIEAMQTIRKRQLGEIKDKASSAANPFYSLGFLITNGMAALLCLIAR